MLIFCDFIQVYYLPQITTLSAVLQTIIVPQSTDTHSLARDTP